MKLDSKFTIKPHEFRHSIVIQRKTYGEIDEDGLPLEETWTDYIKTRAKVINASSKEILQARQVEVEIDKTFYIRARHDKEVTEADRILYKGYIYEISCPPNNKEDGGLYIEIKAKLVK